MREREKVDADYVPTAEQVAAVLGFLPTFERVDFIAARPADPVPGQWVGDIWSDELGAFHRAVYDNGFVFGFDWSSWQETARRYVEDPSALVSADIQVIRRLITLHVRKERFCEGHLPDMVACGHMAAVLRRLAELSTRE